MGCGISKNNNNKKISHNFELIGFSSFDTFFEDAQKILQDAEEIRSGIVDSRQKGLEISHVWKLKEPKYIDVVQVLLWAVSAENGGKIMKVDLDITSEAPFVKIDRNKLALPTYDLYESFSDYLKIIMEAPEKMTDIIQKLVEMSEKGMDLIKEGKAEIQNAEMDLVKKAKAIAQLIKNVAKVGSELSKCKSLQGVALEAKRDMQELVPKFKELLSEADEIGAKAYEEGIYTPGEIFERFHPGLIKGKRPKSKNGKKEQDKEENESENSDSESSDSSDEDSDSEKEEDKIGYENKEKKSKSRSKSKGTKNKKKKKDNKHKKDGKNKQILTVVKIQQIEVRPETMYKTEAKEYGHNRYQDRLATDDIWIQAKTEDKIVPMPSSYIGSQTLTRIDSKSKSKIFSLSRMQNKSHGGLGI